MSNVPVIKAVRAAWSFRQLYWRRVWGVLAAGAVCNVIGSLGRISGTRDAGWWDVVGVLAIPLTVCAYAALMRIAFADEHPGDPEFEIGQQGFQWGRPEWRFLAVVATLGFFAFLGLCVFVFAATLMVGGAALQAILAGNFEALRTSPPGVVRPLFLMWVLFLVVFFVVQTRLSLAPSASIAEKRLVISKSWGMTKGEFWRIAAAQLLALMGPLLAAGVAGGIVSGVLAAGGQKAAGALIAAAISAAVTAFVITPVSVGLSAYLYRGLRRPEDVPAP